MAVLFAAGLSVSAVSYASADYEIFELAGHQRSYICTGYGYDVMSARHQYETAYGQEERTHALAVKSALRACAKKGLAACQTTCFIR